MDSHRFGNNGERKKEYSLFPKFQKELGPPVSETSVWLKIHLDFLCSRRFCRQPIVRSALIRRPNGPILTLLRATKPRPIKENGFDIRTSAFQLPFNLRRNTERFRLEGPVLKPLLQTHGLGIHASY